MGIILDVTPPYWDDYSSHSYPVPNLSISIIKKHFQETDMFFCEQVSRSTPATLHVLDHSRKSQHARCWSAALSLSTALVLTQRGAQPAALLPAAVLSLPVVFLAQSPGSLQLLWLGSPQRMSIFITWGVLALGERFRTIRPLTLPRHPRPVRVPALPRHGWPVTHSSSRCNIRCSTNC